MSNKFSNLVNYSLIAGAITIGSSAFNSVSAFTFSNVPTQNSVGNPEIYNTIPTVGINNSDIGQSFTLNWLLPANTFTNTQNISSTGTFKVNNLSSSNLELQVQLTNTTVSSYQAALMSLGLGVDPNGTATIAQAGTKFDGVSAGSGPNQTFPGGFKNIDVCAFAANGCAGGNINQGLQSGGNSDTFTLNIAGSFGTTPQVTLNSFAVKYQTEDGSYEIPGTIHQGGSTAVPEPSAASAFGVLALASLGLLKKKANK
ncbi:MAG: cistern family PEP-CTERM protein [Xenococcaceae cyanobacterium]